MNGFESQFGNQCIAFDFNLGQGDDNINQGVGAFLYGDIGSDTRISQGYLGQIEKETDNTLVWWLASADLTIFHRVFTSQIVDWSQSHYFQLCDIDNVLSLKFDDTTLLSRSDNGIYTSGKPIIAFDQTNTIDNFEYSSEVSANQPPQVGTITAPSASVQVTTVINASASFTDANTSDTHTASWNWGDGNTTTGTVTESNGSGTVSDTHAYASPGVYTVTLTVTDNSNASGTPTYQYVVAYDSSPNAGFLTGSGKYDSLAGWDLLDTTATGQVKFGIQAKYTGGNSIPTGQTKWNFKNGDLDFTSTSYDWLVVSGSKAVLKGSGTINGSGNYTFLASGIDGSQAGGVDKVRFQIKEESGNLVYDSQSGAADTADPTTSSTGGNIHVH